MFRADETCVALHREFRMPRRKNVRGISPPTTDEDDPMTKDLTKYVTTREAAEMLGVNRFWVVRLLASEKIVGKKTRTRLACIHAVARAVSCEQEQARTTDIQDSTTATANWQRARLIEDLARVVWVHHCGLVFFIKPNSRGAACCSRQPLQRS